MIGRLIRNFLNGQHIIRKVRHVQTVHVAGLHQCAKKVCPAAVLGVRTASSSSNRPSHRSKLLDEYSNNSGSTLLDAYHNNRTDNLQLADLGKRAVAFALDYQGSRFIQQKLGRANPTETAQLVDALRGHVLTLSKNLYGNHVIQKALKSVDKASQIKIVNEISAQVIPLSLHEYGCRVIECLLEHCMEQQKRHVLKQLHGNVLTLVTDKYGCFVISHVIEHGRPEDRERIARSLHENINFLSRHKYGSWVIQCVLDHCTEQQKRPVLEQLLENVLTLATDQYGCFVIEHVIEHGLPEDRERIVHILKGDIMKYAQQKFGNLVILKCLICGTADQKKALIDNVCVGGPKMLQNARQLMADEFGTHVIQKCFEYGTDGQKAQLVDALRGHVFTLTLQIYGGPVIQTALKSVDKASQMEIIEELTARACVIRCIKDQYGMHVMNTIIELIEPEQLQFVVDAIINSPSDPVASLSLHEYGNWVIQRVIKHCTEQQKRPVLEQLLENVLTLATDKYGCFVIEHVIEHGRPEDRERIVCSLLQNVPTLTTDKYGSHVIRHVIEHGWPEDRERIARSLHENQHMTHLFFDKAALGVLVRSLQGDILKNAHHKGICSVIDKCLVFGTTEQRNALIDQVCTDNGSGKPPLLEMMKHPFANEAVLKMHDFADSAHRDKMMFAIKEHIPALIRLQTRQLEQQSLTKRDALADKRKKSNNNGLLGD
uniref:PUM-HD domain-containing protein n=1 Tax=Globodera pallida TaxID=36090 RepID=A0A183CB84_GLOPA